MFGVVEPDENITEELVTIINGKLNIPLKEEDICKIYRMRGRDGKPSGPVMVGFYDCKLKMKIYNGRMQLKGTQVLLNEDLPKDFRDQNRQKRKTREQINKKRLAQQSSEEMDPVDERITQDNKRIRDTGHQLERRDRPPISKPNSSKK